MAEIHMGKEIQNIYFFIEIELFRVQSKKKGTKVTIFAIETPMAIPIIP